LNINIPKNVLLEKKEIQNIHYFVKKQIFFEILGDRRFSSLSVQRIFWKADSDYTSRPIS